MAGVRAGAIGATTMLFACALTACSAGPKCAGQSSIDEGVAAGLPSARAVLGSLLSTHPRWLDQRGWSVGYRSTRLDETVTFVTAGGGDSVKVTRSALNGRWYLDSYRGCA